MTLAALTAGRIWEGGEGVVEKAGRKRHQSEQSQSVSREQEGGEVGLVQPLIRDDSYVSQLKDDKRKGVIRKRGQPDILAGNETQFYLYYCN